MDIKKKEVVYVLTNVARIGELSGQIWRLRNIYDENKYNLTVICEPIDLNPRTNKAVFNIVMRGINVVFSNNSSIISKQGIDRYYAEAVSNPKRIYALLHDTNIINLFVKTNYMKKPKFYYTLTDLELREGESLKKKFGIPDSAPIVTFHLREPGYLSEQKWEDGERKSNSSLENYIPSIAYLINKGYYIVRLGDKSMKRIKNPPIQLIDAPFHPNYSNMVEPYFISQSKFYITTNTGPSPLAWGFGIPLLVVNCVLDSRVIMTNNSLIMFKSIYSKQLNRKLTYEEILLSPIADYCDSNTYFSTSDIEIYENSPEELLLGVKEMCYRLDGTYKDDKTIDLRVRQIQKRVHFVRRHLAPECPVYSPCLRTLYSEEKISHEYLKANPEFLGHDWDNTQ